MSLSTKNFEITSLMDSKEEKKSKKRKKNKDVLFFVRQRDDNGYSEQVNTYKFSNAEMLELKWIVDNYCVNRLNIQTESLAKTFINIIKDIISNADKEQRNRNIIFGRYLKYSLLRAKRFIVKYNSDLDFYKFFTKSAKEMGEK